ncbi:MAG: hypothetical protein ABSG25_04510 [Bryobacteraceae bacterium]
MNKMFLALAIATVSALAQYHMQPAGAPPRQLAPEIRDALAKDGAGIAGPKSAICDIWLRKKAPLDGDNHERDASFRNIQQGALLGAIRFQTSATDRRGQTLDAGVYTMRLSFFPVNENHREISPTRDFILLVPAADDRDLDAAPDFERLVKMSAKASGTAHPAVLNVWKPDSAGPALLKHEGDDWVLYASMGDVPIAILVIGTYLQ